MGSNIYPLYHHVWCEPCGQDICIQGHESPVSGTMGGCIDDEAESCYNLIHVTINIHRVCILDKYQVLTAALSSFCHVNEMPLNCLSTFEKK